MTTNYVLIDFESVQPKDMASLNAPTCKVLVFVGANQKKLSVDLVESLQPLGQNVSYIRVSGNGPNALDFHIAFYLGELAASDPQGVFRVISKDTGFDPLLVHLKSRGIRAQRSDAICETPVSSVATHNTFDERVAAVLKDLKSRGNARPRRRKTLASTIHALFKKELEPSEVEGLIAAVANRGVTVAPDGKVTYTF